MGSWSSSREPLTGASRGIRIGVRQGGQNVDYRAIRYIAAIAFTDPFCECLLELSLIFHLLSDRQE